MPRKKRKSNYNPEADFLRAKAILDADAELRRLHGSRLRYSKLKTARQLLYHASNKDHVDAQWQLALCCISGTGIRKPDKERFIIWGMIAADNGHPDAPAGVGQFLYTEMKRFSDAAPYLRKAAEHGHLDCYYYLGDYYHHGRGGAIDYLEAAKCYERAFNSQKQSDEDERSKARKGIEEIAGLMRGSSIVQKGAIMNIVDRVLSSSVTAPVSDPSPSNIIPPDVFAGRRQIAISRAVAAVRPNQAQVAIGEANESAPNSGGFD